MDGINPQMLVEMKNSNERSITARLNKLCNFIEEHSFRAYPYNGAIMAEMLYSSPEGSFTKWEMVEPTWQAVRDWLGY